MAKRRKTPRVTASRQDDGVVRIVTDDSPTIQASIPTEDEAAVLMSLSVAEPEPPPPPSVEEIVTAPFEVAAEQAPIEVAAEEVLTEESAEPAQPPSLDDPIIPWEDAPADVSAPVEVVVVAESPPSNDDAAALMDDAIFLADVHREMLESTIEVDDAALDRIEAPQEVTHDVSEPIYAIIPDSALTVVPKPFDLSFFTQIGGGVAPLLVAPPAEEPPPAEALFETVELPTSVEVEEPPPLQEEPPIFLDAEELPAPEVVEDSANVETSVYAAPIEDAVVVSPIDENASSIEVVTGSHEVIVSRTTEPYPDHIDVFNPRVWELEAELRTTQSEVESLTTRLNVETAKRLADLAEAVALSEQVLNDIRACRLWGVRIDKVQILVMAHNAIEAIQKATDHAGVRIDKVGEVRPVADKVVI